MFVRHIRVSCLGTLPGNEIFSFGFALGLAGAGDTAANFLARFADPNSAEYDDIRDDIATFWNSLSCNSNTRLMKVKFAKIGPDGLYVAPPVERGFGLAGVGLPGNGGNASRFANQDALAMTLHTTGDLGRVKGRFYVPMPEATVGPDGRIAEGERDGLETALQKLVTDVNNQPGLDVYDMKVVVASQGRRHKGTKNPDGTVTPGAVKAGPENYVVSAVSVGRAPDTIRRRRNKLSEFRGTVSQIG